MDGKIPGLYGGDWEPERKPMSQGGRLMAWAVVLAVVLIGTYEVTKFVRSELKLARLRSTLAKVREIAVVIEDVTYRDHENYPCLQHPGDFPGKMANALKPETFIDAWGRRMIIVSSPRRYLIMSLGSDGKRDRAYDKPWFDPEDDTNDVIFSNGDPIHHPEGLSTAYSLPPAIPDALREAEDCHAAPLPSFDSDYYLFSVRGAGAQRCGRLCRDGIRYGNASLGIQDEMARDRKRLASRRNVGSGQEARRRCVLLILLCHFSGRSSGKSCPRRLKRLRRRSSRSSCVRSRRGR